MIEAVVVQNMLEEIEEYELDGIMNAANGIGPMGGGIAGAIRRYGGVEIQDDAFRVCKKFDPQPGDAYYTIAGCLDVKHIIHAVTMKQPGGATSYDFVGRAFESALYLACKKGITRIGCTALGTGVGGLDPVRVAKIMMEYLRDNDFEIDIIFMDRDEDFINTIKEEM